MGRRRAGPHHVHRSVVGAKRREHRRRDGRAAASVRVPGVDALTANTAAAEEWRASIGITF
jgi:hypothetical protein